MENTLIDKELWKLFKHLSPEVDLDQLPVDKLAKLLKEMTILPQTASVLTIANRIQQIRSYRKALKHLQQQPHIAQRSPAWHELRRNRLTASDMAQAMGRGKFGNRSQLLKKKAFPDDTPFNMNAEPLRWGVMFEPIASRSYSQRMNDMVIHDFGLIPHPTISCFGASPDGITDLGIMVEFKCPWRRKIDGNVLEQYEIQMQGQMAVCGLDECHFVECDIQKFANEAEYISEIRENITTDHGVILEYPTTYLYSPEYMTPKDAIQWATEQPMGGKHVYWKLRKYHMCSVLFDAERWATMLPLVEDFWRDVEQLRTSPHIQETSAKQRKLDFIEDEDDA